MRTFLPHPDFAASAAVLDSKRLGKQRVETLQVVRALTVPGYGWQNHPAVLMWRGHLEALGRHGLVVVQEWVARGFGDRSALLRKDPDRYGPRFPGVPDDLPHVWPVRSARAVEAERKRSERSTGSAPVIGPGPTGS